MALSTAHLLPQPLLRHPALGSERTGLRDQGNSVRLERKQ